MKNFIVGALIIGVAIVVGFFVANPSAQYGASSGPDHFNMEYFHAGMTDGGKVTTLTAASTTSFTAAQACESSVITYTSTYTGASTTTLPGAAAMIASCLRENGESRVLLFRNTTTNTASTTVIKVASTTSDTLLMPETNGADVIIDGGQSAWIKFIRTSATAMIILVAEYINGD